MASIETFKNFDNYTSSLQKSLNCQKAQFEYLAKEFEHERQHIAHHLDKLSLADLQPLQYVNFEDELENLESVQKSSNSKTYDIRDDSNEELSDIVSLQSITLTNDSLKLNKSSQNTTLTENLQTQNKMKTIKKSESSCNRIKTETSKTNKEVIRVKKTRRTKNEQKQNNMLKVTIENLSESSDDDIQRRSCGYQIDDITIPIQYTNQTREPIKNPKLSTKMVDNRPSSQTDFNNPRKDHYSYSYSYKTGGDTENGIPSVNTVEVNESVTEEIGPDGSKIIRRHQQEKQVNKITQVVTQRVIKRQYIDPNTGQIIEYDPNNELFANLPPETVFEEHTIISDDNPPVITTTTLSKTNNNSNKNLTNQYSSLNEADCVDNVTVYRQQQQTNVEAAVAAVANLKIKSHPEDNQGYPEERNMDYDPDDSYPDDDSPYEGLIQTPNQYDDHKSKRKSNRKKGVLNDLIDTEQLIHSGVSSSGSSSSPIIFENNIDMPFVSNQQQYSKSSYKYTRTNEQNGSYTTVLPSSNIPTGSTTPRGGPNYNNSTNYYQTIGKFQNQQLSIDPYSQIGQQQHAPHSHRSQQSVYQKHIQSQHQQSSPNLNNGDYEQNGIVVGGWRNPTLPEVIEYLTHQSNEIKANAAAYLQHLCYQDDHIKAETRHLGGILKLVNLLNSENHDVHKNACGALRNLSYGKTNDENKIDIRDKGGIPALVRLLKRTQDENVRETITAVLWNLSSCEEIKEPILYEGLYALVKYIIVPYSNIDVLNSQNSNRASLMNGIKSSQRLLNNDYSNYPTVLTNATGVLRNCSSNLQFSNCYEARKKLREADGFIEALLRIVDQAVEPYINENYYKKQQIVNLDLIIKDNMNSKCVENCMCILRNLSFRLQEIVDPNYDREVRPFPGDEKTVKCGGTSSGKKRKNLEEDFLNSVYPYNMPVPNEGKAQELLWSLNTLNKYLIIIKESTVRDTIEAAVGCLQNLTACYWRPSVVIRQEIRRLKGLPTLVHLLKSDEYEDEPIVSVTAIALRNLAIDGKNRELIGKYAMKDLVAKLPDPSRQIPFRLSVLNEDTITAALACINECIKSSDEFVKSCYNEGGVKRMIYITRNGQHFPIKIVKYAAHVLASMWKHKNLHDLLKKDGYKETDFTNVAKQMGLKSQSSSPANTLHRPRGDVNVKPSMSGGSGTSKKSKNKTKSHSKSSEQLADMPIYSQVQRGQMQTGSNKNLIVTNGSTNADSWV